MAQIVMTDALLSAILATQLAQLGFEARLLRRQSKLRAKVKTLWNQYTESRDRIKSD